MTRAAPGPRVGKRVGGALYVHRSAVHLLDDVSRGRLLAAERHVRDDWNVAKLDDRAVSLLLYEDFDATAFPCLLHGARFDGAKVARTGYGGRANPPVLHRKELLLPADDARVPTFAALTRAAEERGLFVAPHRIGTRNAWAARLAEAGMRVEGHALVPVRAETVEIARHRTAIVRSTLSAPMQALVRHDFVGPGKTVLDYGCGQGDDVRALVEGGVEATGWDPHFRPDGALAPADAVNLGFVLNVIERPSERIETLRRAWSCCRRVMAVAVMIAGHRPTTGLQPYGDGFLTSRGTFQRYFTPDELKGMVRDALGVEGFAVGLGVVLAFKDPVDEREFLFRRQVRRAERAVPYSPPRRERTVLMREPLADRIRPTLDALWGVMLGLGRTPTVDELPSAVAGPLKASNVSVTRAIGWCGELYERKDFERAATARKEDLLLYFALGAFTKSVALGDLASSLQRDARAFFGGATRAREAAMAFLFTLGDADLVRAARGQAIEGGLAHGFGEAGLHFRREGKDDLPLPLRGLVGCASVLYGDLDDVDVIAIDTARMHVDMLFTADFDAKLPVIVRRTRIGLRRQTIDDRLMVGDDRRIFVARSCYANDENERSVRMDLERRIASLPTVRRGELSVRQTDVVRGLKDTITPTGAP